MTKATIETERLLINPLTLKQLKKYIESEGSLQHELALTLPLPELHPDLHAAFTQSLKTEIAEPDVPFSTLWLLVGKSEQCIVGSFIFNGQPNAAGEVELGYGTEPQFQGKGYMTEAVGAAVQWARSQPKIKAVIAGTEKLNQPSFRVLEKNGFEKYDERGEMLWWRLATV